MSYAVDASDWANKAGTARGRRVGSYAQRLHTVFSNCGLRNNFWPDKTATVLRLYGSGAQTAYRALRTGSGGLAMACGAGVCTVVHSNKHVGTALQSDGLHRPDASKKAAQHQAPCGPMVRTVFGRACSNGDTRALLVRPLLDSQLLCGSELWLTPDTKAMRRA